MPAWKSSYSFLTASGDQLARADLERLRELLDHGDGWVAPRTFDVADVGAVDAGAVGIILLAPASRLAEAADVLGEAGAYLHDHPQTAMQLINLQTISHIRVDCSSTQSVCRSLRLIVYKGE